MTVLSSLRREWARSCRPPAKSTFATATLLVACSALAPLARTAAAKPAPAPLRRSPAAAPAVPTSPAAPAVPTSPAASPPPVPPPVPPPLPVGAAFRPAPSVQPAPPAAWRFDWYGKAAAEAANLGAGATSERIALLARLATYDPRLVAPIVEPLLQDRDELVAAHAARLLGRAGHASAPAALDRFVTAPDPKLRALAVEGYAGFATSAAPAMLASLVRSLGDVDANVRLQAVRVLGAYGAAGVPEIAFRLVPRLADDVAEVRQQALTQLAALRDPAALVPLAARLSDPSTEIRKAAARAVAQLGDPRVAPPLMRLLTDPSDDVRIAAIDAVGQLGIDAAVPPLIELLAHATEAVRQRAAQALATLAQVSPNTRTRKLAIDAFMVELEAGNLPLARPGLVALGAAAVPALARALDTSERGRDVITMLRDVRTPTAAPVLVTELQRGRYPLTELLAALGTTGATSAMVPVLGFVEHRELSVRRAAMVALGDLLGDDQRAADALLGRLRDTDAEVQRLAIDYLGRLRAEAASAPLVEIARTHRDRSMQLAAVAALGEIGGNTAVDHLRATLLAPDPALRYLASRALSDLVVPALLEQAPRLLAVLQGPALRDTVLALRATWTHTPAGQLAALRPQLERLAQRGAPGTSQAATRLLAEHPTASASTDAVLASLLQDGRLGQQQAALWGLARHGALSLATLQASATSASDALAASALHVAWRAIASASGYTDAPAQPADPRRAGQAAQAAARAPALGVAFTAAAALTLATAGCAPHWQAHLRWASCINASALLAQRAKHLRGPERRVFEQQLAQWAQHPVEAVRHNALMGLAYLGFTPATAALAREGLARRATLPTARALAQYLAVADAAYHQDFARTNTAYASAANAVTADIPSVTPRPAPAAAVPMTFDVASRGTPRHGKHQPWAILDQTGLLHAAYTDELGLLDWMGLAPADRQAGPFPQAGE